MIGERISGLSIQKKLLLAIFSVSVLVSVSSFVLIWFNQKDRLHNELTDNLTFLSKIVGEYSVATIIFDDRDGAEKVLEKLAAIPYITNAYIYDTTGVVYARYPATKVKDLSLKNPKYVRDSLYETNKSIIIIDDILYENSRYGYIQLFASRDYINGKINSNLIYLSMLFILIVFISYFLAKWIRRPLTNPIVELSNQINDITINDNYKVDISHNSKDEIGDLYRGIDVMIKKIRVQIEKQIKAEQVLSQMNEELEETVNRRTILLEAAIEQLKLEVEERERTTQELLETKDSLSKALTNEKELVDMKNRFINMISHEYRTPLTVIMSSLSLLEKYSVPNNPARFDSHTQKIRIAIKRMLEMLNDILTLGRVEDRRFVLNKEDVKVMVVFEELINELNVIFEDKHTIEINCIDENLFVNTDLNAFTHIFRNLLSNAYKYTIESSTIMVNVLKLDAGKVMFEVIDNGIGIPEDFKDKMFEPFNRSSNATNIQGTGLGLSIVKKYVEELGGSIDYQSFEGKGTKFTVVL